MRLIHLTRGKIATVDDADYESVARYSWAAYPSYSDSSRWYALRGFRVDGKQTTLPMHRQILGLGRGDPFVDHADGNGLNNQRSNIRIATSAQNCANSRKPCTNTSGLKGVSARDRRFRATVGRKHIGWFDSAVMAARAYDTAAVAKYGAFAKINFPMEGAMPVSAEDFIRCWMLARTRREAADAMGISSAAAGTRAAKMRAEGIPLKKFSRGSSVGTHDVEALKRLAKDLNPRSEK